MVDDASELVQVSGPVVVREHRECLGREPGPLRAATLIGALEEVLRQNRQLVAALAERAQANDERGQGEVEVRPDPLARECDLGVEDRRADQSDRANRARQPAVLASRGGA